MSETRNSTLWQLSDAELTSTLLACETTLRREYAHMLAVLAEAEQRGLASSLGYRDSAALLTSSLRISNREAQTRVSLATETVATSSSVKEPQSAPLARTGQTLAEGEINPEHAAEIAKVFAQCPDAIDGDSRAESEQSLLRLAKQAMPETVRKAGRRLLAYWDQDGRAPEAADRELAFPRREFRYRYTRTGQLKFAGELDPETAAQLEGLFGPLAKPEPVDEHGNTDPRTAAERHGDAFADIIDLAARADELGTQGGERAVIIATVTVDELENRVRERLLDIPGNPSLSTLRRLACAAKVIPAIFGSEGEPLYVGRGARHATPAQRRALVLRDRGCAQPGCMRTPKWCTPHHILPWAEGGSTDLDNLVLLCGRHHRQIHHTDWEVRIAHGLPQFIPPIWFDPRRKPLHNHAHDSPPTFSAAA